MHKTTLPTHNANRELLELEMVGLALTFAKFVSKSTEHFKLNRTPVSENTQRAFDGVYKDRNTLCTFNSLFRYEWSVYYEKCTNSGRKQT